jgi:hypothetical protein
MRVQILVALGHEYALPAGKPKELAILTPPDAVRELATLRSLLLFNLSMN